MTAPSSPSTKAEWIDRLAPLLAISLDETNERITSAAPIQRWLHKASFEAASGLATASNMQAQAEAYRWMIDDLESSFAPLVEAIDELTEGCGHLDLNWRPLAPNYSRVFIAFDRSFEVDLFYRLNALDSGEAARAVQTIRQALPAGEPFPNRPNQATGLVAHEGRCVGVRVRDHLDEAGKRWQRATLLPKNHEPLKNLLVSDAPQRLIQLFTDDET